MYPHRIRLRGPWACETLERRAGAAPPNRLTLPAGPGSFRGRVRLGRRFGYPGQIDAHERVWLTIAGVAGSADVWLNGQWLGRQDQPLTPGEFAVTSLLRERNELTLVVETAEEAGDSWGEFALEVRAMAFLGRVEATVVRPGPRLSVRGEVRGSSDAALDLYALVDRANVGYVSLAPERVGRPFELLSEVIVAESVGEVCVELVNGAVVWDRVVCAVGTNQATS